MTQKVPLDRYRPNRRRKMQGCLAEGMSTDSTRRPRDSRPQKICTRTTSTMALAGVEVIGQALGWYAHSLHRGRPTPF
jgi:hypothetical protein